MPALQQNRWPRVPTEIARRILLALEPRDLMRMSCADRRLYRVTCSDWTVWRTFYQRHYPVDPLEASWLTWRLADCMDDGRFRSAEQLLTLSDVNWLVLYRDRVLLENNWRRGSSQHRQIALPLEMFDAMTTTAPHVVATRAWGTLLHAHDGTLWLAEHSVDGYGRVRMLHLRQTGPQGLAANVGASAVSLLSAWMGDGGMVVVHGRLSETQATPPLANVGPVDGCIWVWQVRDDTRSTVACRQVPITAGAELVEVKGHWALGRHTAYPGTMVYSVCDLRYGQWQPVLLPSERAAIEPCQRRADRQAGIAVSSMHRSLTKDEVSAEAAHLHAVEEDSVLIFQCRWMVNGFSWELVRHWMARNVASNKVAGSTATYTVGMIDGQQQTTSTGGQLHTATSTLLTDDSVLLQYAVRSSPTMRVAALSLKWNRIMWEFSNMIVRQAVPLAVKDMMILCDAEKRYRICGLQRGTPQYDSGWPVGARLTHVFGTVCLVEESKARTRTLLDAVTGKQLAKLPDLETLQIAAPCGGGGGDLTDDSVENPLWQSWQPWHSVVTSSVHLGFVDTSSRAYHMLCFF
ncbi:hypothetical protein THASP1DRAFT_30165 [Thamnocephalis sphaerospora]|uniref:F-box domain-containing protein n=1 Tax=Thamnocephalis sphaerospora TaxID=78915 RepID=A0A4P9XRS1_9FUNG|nr:hypothetical protein THASP1DRAFT_30165 [Thamnocephalis sphaerospora]|eukprot:RKP08030.1 hypothetical protein THASP1DRAFT_30165 [Thamnocephalis sphaerospora]